MFSETDGLMDNNQENPSECSRKYLLKIIKGNIKLYVQIKILFL